MRIDECKAMLWEGGAIEMDLEKDLGLTGTYTLPVSNPVLPPLIRARAERKGWAGSAYRFLIESSEILLRKKMLAMRETLLFLVWIALWNHRGDSGDSAA